MNVHKEIYISEMAQETRIAILENLELVEFFVEKQENQRMVGNIYKGKIENVIKGISAAFVDIGQELNAFLPFAEISDPDTVFSIMDLIKQEKGFEVVAKSGNGAKDEPPAEINFKRDQEILVQVIKEPFARKGARVTTDISMPGRYLVLVPGDNYIGISKKINSRKEKGRLKTIAKEIKPNNFGIIIRTVAEGQKRESLEADLNNLLEMWESLLENARKNPAPALIYSDMGTASSVMRDLMTPDVDKIVVDKKNLYKNIHSYIKSVSPDYLQKLEYHTSKVPLFDQYNIEKQYEKSLSKKVWLKNGGFIIIEHTEAMTTIDVNSGKFVSKKDHEKTSLKTNLEAAREIAKQLRLRDIGGLIVIDFIDMEDSSNKEKVYQELRRELMRDRAKVALARLSDFGLLEMTRQRIRLNLIDSVSEECPLCQGSGRITSKASVVTKMEGWFRRLRSQSRERRLTLYIHPELADYIRESSKNLFTKIQFKHFMRIRVVEDASINVDDFKVFSTKKGIEITDKY